MSYEYEVPISLLPGGVSPVDWDELVSRVRKSESITTVSMVEPFWQPKDYGISFVLYFDGEPTGDNRSPGPATGEKLVIDNIVSSAVPIQEFVRIDGGKNYASNRAPVSTDDTASGFRQADKWTDILTGNIYICRSEVEGAAIWDCLTLLGQLRPEDKPKFLAALMTDGEASPVIDEVFVSDGSGDWDLGGYGGTKDRGYYENHGLETSTTSSAVRMDETPTLKAGRYLIQWSSSIKGTSTGTQHSGKFFFDGEEFASPSGKGRFKFDGFIEKVVSAGPFNIRLEVHKDSGGGSAQMMNSRIRYAWIADS